MLRLNKLTARFVASKGLAPGRYGDGAGLYLSVTPAGGRRYTFMYRDRETGQQHELFLGNVYTLSLLDARAIRLALQKQLLEGLDPKTVRFAAKAVRKASRARKTFGAVVDTYLASPNVTRFRNAKHKQQWASTLGAPCADLHPRYVDEIGTEDVVQTLAPIFDRTPETARRLQGRIEAVLGFAGVNGWRSGDNPARWAHHLETHFAPRSALERGQHAAMRWQDVPAFYAGLPNTIPGLALRSLILTATRAGEMLGAEWSELSDLDGTAAMWVIPASRMKRGRGMTSRCPPAPWISCGASPISASTVSSSRDASATSRSRFRGAHVACRQAGDASRFQVKFPHVGRRSGDPPRDRRGLPRARVRRSD